MFAFAGRDGTDVVVLDAKGERLPGELERVAEVLAAKLDVGKVDERQPLACFRPRLACEGERVLHRFQLARRIAECLVRGRFRHSRLDHLGRAAGGVGEAIGLDARVERVLRLLQHHIQRRELIQRRGAPVGVVLLLGERQRVLQRPQRLLELPAAAGRDADRQCGPVREIGIGGGHQPPGLLGVRVSPWRRRPRAIRGGAQQQRSRREAGSRAGVVASRWRRSATASASADFARRRPLPGRRARTHAGDRPEGRRPPVVAARPSSFLGRAWEAVERCLDFLRLP
jgi:hypothetical protein